jgi:hypothetical protein
MTDDQAERLIRELKAIKHALWIAILFWAVVFATLQVVAAVFGPPPPTVTVQAPK